MVLQNYIDITTSNYGLIIVKLEQVFIFKIFSNGKLSENI